MLLGLWWMSAGRGGQEASGECPQPLVDDGVARGPGWLADPENATPAEGLVVRCADVGGLVGG